MDQRAPPLVLGVAVCSVPGALTGSTAKPQPTAASVHGYHAGGLNPGVRRGAQVPSVCVCVRAGVCGSLHVCTACVRGAAVSSAALDKTELCKSG